MTIGDPSVLRSGFAMGDSAAEVAAAVGIMEVKSVVDIWRIQ